MKYYLLFFTLWKSVNNHLFILGGEWIRICLPPLTNIINKKVQISWTQFMIYLRKLRQIRIVHFIVRIVLILWSNKICYFSYDYVNGLSLFPFYVLFKKAAFVLICGKMSNSHLIIFIMINKIDQYRKILVLVIVIMIV